MEPATNLSIRHAEESRQYLSTPIKGTRDKSLCGSQSRLFINDHIPANNQEEVEEVSPIELTIERPKSRMAKINIENEVQLPKIRFVTQNSEVRSRKNSAVIVQIETTQNKFLQTPNYQRIQGKFENLDNSSSQQQSSHSLQQGGWNINNIKILPSKQIIPAQNLSLSIGGYQQKNKAIHETGLTATRQTHHNLQKQNLTSQQLIQREKNQSERSSERQTNIRIISNYLSGKATFIWLFILHPQINEKELSLVQAMYSTYLSNDFQIPICKGYQQSIKFLTISSCFFKVVVDLECSERLLQNSNLHSNIIAIYIYNSKKEKGMQLIYAMRQKERRIKGMFSTLSDAANQAEMEIQNEAKFVIGSDGLERYGSANRFPNFFILSQNDSSVITSYRLCLYASLKLKSPKEREVYLKQFIDLVEIRYDGVPQQLKYLEEYKAIDHLSENSQNKARSILSFYVRETFYYALTNLILRISRSPQEFRPCTIPFNQTYQAIKLFYSKYKEEVKGKPKRLVSYRGAKLASSDVKYLQVGNYIQLLGFTSTSLSRLQAQKFMDHDSYLIQIVVENYAKNNEQQVYDHGYVEINRYGLATKGFQEQQEVLFNALNVFEVTEIDLISRIRKITVKYGAVLELLREKARNLTQQKRKIMSNYQYCVKVFNTIENDGDFFLLAQDHSKSIQYYQTKIDQGDHSYSIYGRMAQAQLQNGNLEEAYNNALKSMQSLSRQPEENQNKIAENYTKIQRNRDIFDLKEDIVHYDLTVDKFLKILKEDWLKQVKILKERANKRLKIGDYSNCQLDIKKCKKLLNDKQLSFQEDRKEIHRKYFFRLLCCACCGTARAQLEEQKQLQLLRIQEEEIDFQSKIDVINQVRLQLQYLLNRLAQQVNNKQLLFECKQSSKLHVKAIQKYVHQNDGPRAAKYLILEAKYVDMNQNNHQKVQMLIERAIQKAEKTDPFNRNVGEYYSMLGAYRHNIVKRRHLQPLYYRSKDKTREQGNNQSDYLQSRQELIKNAQKYPYEHDQQLYQKSHESFSKAAEIIAYCKGTQNSDYISTRNCITELDLDYSYLKEASKSAQKTIDIKMCKNHSQGAKCYLLLAKISLAQGQLKQAFVHIQTSYEILRSSLVKLDNKEYNRVFTNHPYYFEICIQKVRIFKRQLKHDLAFRQLKMIKKIVSANLDNSHSKDVLATIFDEQSQILFWLGQTISFQQSMLKAIQIRQQEMGRYNIPNGVAYQNLFKFLRILDDKDEALNYHFKASQIFSRFPYDHPNSWIIYLSNALYFSQKNQIEESISHMQFCVKIARKRYSKDHIHLMKILFQYGKIMNTMKAYQKAQDTLLHLQALLEQNLTESQYKQILERETDDQKLPLRKSLYSLLKEIYNQLMQKQQRYILEASRCQDKLNQFSHIQSSTNQSSQWVL